jgi:hypothetical protein
MKICNRKLAKRIQENERALHILVTERQFDPRADFKAVRETIARTHEALRQDKATLEAHGYDVKGKKKEEATCTLEKS